MDWGKQFTQEQETTEGGGRALFLPNWAQPPLSQRCLAHDKAAPVGTLHIIIAERQVTASWQHFLLQHKHADSAGCQACLCLFLCWAQPGVTQVRLHTDTQGAQRAFIYFLHAAERALKGTC